MTWEQQALRHLATVTVSNVDKHSVEGDPGVRLCNYTDVYKNETITDDMAFMVATATPSQVRQFRLSHGDTVITKDSETADDIGIPAFIESPGDDLICGYHLAVLRPLVAKVYPKYLTWAMRSRPVMAQWEVLAKGVTRVGLKQIDMRGLQVPISVDLAKQRAIAEFLDRETAKIDALIEKQTRLIDRLRERRTSVIERSTTFGIEGEQVRETDNVWVPVLPASWTLSRIKMVTTKAAGGTPDTDDLTMWTDEPDDGFAWVAIGDMSKRRHVAETNKRVTEHGRSSRRLPIGAPGTVLFAMYASVGEVAQLDGHACWNQALIGLNGREGFVENDYLYYALLSMRSRFSAMFRSTTQNNLNAAQVGGLDLALPPPDQQRAIAQHLDSETAKIDALIAKAERFIELARERRSALITAAVTGQIDVTAGATA